MRKPRINWSDPAGRAWPTAETGQQTVPSALRPPRSRLGDTMQPAPYLIVRPDVGPEIGVTRPPARVLAERQLARLPLAGRLGAAWRIIRRRPGR